MTVLIEGGIDIGPGIALGGGTPVPSSGGYIDIFGDSFTTNISISHHNSLVYDNSNNLYAVGSTDISGVTKGIVSKFNVSGTLQWQRTLGASSPNNTGFTALDIDSSNNLYVTGFTSSDGTIDGRNIQIVKYDTNGTLQWQKTLGGSSFLEMGLSLLVEQSTGDFYVSGIFATTSGATISRSIVAKYNSSGVLQWQTGLTPAVSSDNADFQDIALDSAGNLYIVGSTPTSTSSNQGMLIKYNSSGALQWQVGLSKATGQSIFYGITIDSSDNIFVCGTSLTGIGGTSYGVVAKYNTSGALQWKKQIGDSGGYPVLLDITLDSSGNIYATGFGGPNSSSYVIKLDTSGSIQWQRNFSATSYYAQMYSIAMDSTDSLVVGGYTRDTSVNINQMLMLRVPNDGTPTGTYTADGISFTYSTSSLPIADLSAWSTTTTSLTNGATSFTAGTSSLTGATSSYTNSVTPIPGGTPGVNNVIGYNEMPPPVTAGGTLQDSTATVNGSTGFTINNDANTGISINGLSASNQTFFATYGTGTKTCTWGAGSTVASSTINVVVNDPGGFPEFVFFVVGQSGAATYNYPFTFS
jgi:hypothetical protein